MHLGRAVKDWGNKIMEHKFEIESSGAHKVVALMIGDVQAQRVLMASNNQHLDVNAVKQVNDIPVFVLADQINVMPVPVLSRCGIITTHGVLSHFLGVSERISKWHQYNITSRWVLKKML